MIETYNFNTKGHYEVAGTRFHNKLEAIVHAKQVGWQGITWDFNNHAWDQINWEVDPDESLEELYRDRAQQIRDTYDHVVVFLSGGSDSFTVLKSFINNNIPIDDVMMYGAFKAEENVRNTLGAEDAGYFTREVEHIAKPILREILKKHKINVIEWDWTDYILDSFTDLDWIWRVGGRFGANMWARANFHNVFKHHRRLEDAGKKVAFVWGIDKPRLVHDGENIYHVFLDVLLSTGTGNSSNILDRAWENDEYFFWSANMPKLVVKQAHTVINHLTKTNQLDVIPHMNNMGGWHDPRYYAAVKPILYPEWRAETWQVIKPSSPTYNETDKWLFDTRPDSYHRWESSLKEVERIVGPEWLSGGTIRGGLHGCLSPKKQVAKYKKDIII